MSPPAAGFDCYEGGCRVRPPRTTATPSVIRSTGPRTRSERSQRASASSRKTIPATTKNTPVTSADRLLRASAMLDPHFTDADRGDECDRRRADRSRDGDLGVDPAFLLVKHLNVPEPRASLHADRRLLGDDHDELADPDPRPKLGSSDDRLEVHAR